MSTKVCVLVSDLFSLLGTIVLIVCVSVIYYSLAGLDFRYLHRVGSSWKDGPVSSVSPLVNRDRCPANTQSLIGGKYPGSLPGCNCKGDITEGACSAANFRNNCTNVNATPAINFRGWGDKSVCGQRLKNSYFELPTSVNGTCANNTKVCGKLDTKGTLLCLNKTETCPLNKLLILPINATVPKDFNYTVRRLPDINKKLVYTNQNTKGLVVNELVVADGVPCADPTEADVGGKPYVLDPRAKATACSTTVNGQKYDTSFVLLDKMPYGQLLKENGLYNLVNDLPKYPKAYFNHSVGIYMRPYIGLNATCVKLAKQLYSKPQDIVSNFMYSEQNLNKTIANPVSSAALGFLIFFIVLALLLFKLGLYIYYEKPVVEVGRVYINATVAFFIFLLFIAGIIACIKISAIRNNYIWISNDPNCTDPFTFAIIQAFDKKVAAAYSAAVVFTILGLIMLMLPLVEYLLKTCGDKKDKGDNYEELNDDGEDGEKEEASNQPTEKPADNSEKKEISEK